MSYANRIKPHLRAMPAMGFAQLSPSFGLHDLRIDEPMHNTQSASHGLHP